jgi:hypothetical protein
VRTYSIFTPQRWIGTTGKRLRRGILDRKPGDPEREAYKDAQIVADVLLNNPNANHYGLYYITLLTIADLTGLLADEIARALVILEREEFSFYDDATEFVWVKEMARVQMFLPLKPGDRQVKSTNTWYRQVPRNPFLGPFFDRYNEDLRLETKREEWAPRTPKLPLETAAVAVGDRAADAASSTSLFQQWFCIFLEAYPAARRVGGAAGETAFKNAMRGQGQDHLNVMLDALWYQRKSEQWRRGVIPSMVKWLDEQHWTRDLPGGPSNAPRFECPDGHEDCRSPGQHALRAALDAVCRHAFRCQTFLEHYQKEVEDAEHEPV